MVILLGVEIAKKEIIKAVIREFLRRGLHKTYAKEIAEWQKYYREKKFAVKLDKQMRKEIERFKRTIKKWTPEKLRGFVIEGLDCLK